MAEKKEKKLLLFLITNFMETTFRNIFFINIRFYFQVEQLGKFSGRHFCFGINVVF